MDKFEYNELLNNITNFIKIIPEYDFNVKGKGVIICGGDTHYISGSIIVNLLQKYNKNINIEWYYVGDELNKENIETLEKKNVDVINCLNVLPNWWYNTIIEKDIKGFMIKPFALMQSKFEDILLLDSDNIPIKDINFLFEYSDYIEYGHLFWSDYNYKKNIKMYDILLPYGVNIFSKLKIKSPFENNINLTDSGQILINKKKMWKGICLAFYLNYNKNIYYKMVYGDKDLYYIAFQLLNIPYKQCIYYPDGIGNNNKITTMINKNPINNTPLFIHFTLNKINNNNTYIKPTTYFDISNDKIDNIQNGYIICNNDKMINLSFTIKKDLLELYNFINDLDKKIPNQINKKINKKIRLFICTPTYGYTCDIRYLTCLLETKDFLISKGIEVELSFIGYESLIPRARNTFVARFLANPENTHLLFIDGDIMWEKEDVLKLILRDKDLIGGLYPQKKYHWNRLNNVNNNESYKLLNYNINLLNDNSRKIVNGLIKVKHIATGFMMIRRNVLLNMIKKFPEMKYQDDINSCSKQEEKFLYSFFDCVIDNGHYLSEDYYFCSLWEKLNGDIYADFSINLSHIGSEVYSGKPSNLIV